MYFPDLCFLLLLRTTNPSLYDWVEEYLSERAVVESGDGSVSDEEQQALTDSLKMHLKLYFPTRAHSVLTLSEWVPGISGGLPQLPVTLFSRTGVEQSAVLTAGKRLGSQAYWRYYFAFSAPQNVLEPKIFEELFELASKPELQQELANRLLGYIQSKKLSTRTWFGHILAQLTIPLVESRTTAECRGLLQFFFNSGDDMLERYRVNNEWLGLHDLDTYSVADRLIRRMLREDETETMTFLTDQARNGRAWYWIAEYVRHLLWQHGRAGDRAEHQLEMWMDLEKVDTVRDALSDRLKSPAITNRLVDFPLLNAYIWAWRDISGEDVVQKWVNGLIVKDEAFMNLLLQLRHQGISSVDGRYLALNLSSMTAFLGEEEQIRNRIACIKEAGHCAAQVAQVELSIERNRF
ncbi:hypothetical protein [Citrobacter portucalensis]|uniref:hypothetical protein n=1 Tax=Citrobacter portucalensis TaxID=1639133 RepID=UPI00216AF348|nr:hypothetical protein [Citrobacter portucalensis]